MRIIESFTVCKKMLDLYRDRYNSQDDCTMLFAFDMTLEKTISGADDSTDPALFAIFERLWGNRSVLGSFEAFSCAMQFLKEELIELRKSQDSVLIADCNRALVEPKDSSVLLPLWTVVVAGMQSTT